MRKRVARLNFILFCGDGREICCTFAIRLHENKRKKSVRSVITYFSHFFRLSLSLVLSFSFCLPSFRPNFSAVNFNSFRWVSHIPGGIKFCVFYSPTLPLNLFLFFSFLNLIYFLFYFIPAPSPPTLSLLSFLNKKGIRNRFFILCIIK